MTFTIFRFSEPFGNIFCLHVFYTNFRFISIGDKGALSHFYFYFISFRYEGADRGYLSTFSIPLILSPSPFLLSPFSFSPFSLPSFFPFLSPFSSLPTLSPFSLPFYPFSPYSLSPFTLSAPSDILRNNTKLDSFFEKFGSP